MGWDGVTAKALLLFFVYIDFDLILFSCCI